MEELRAELPELPVDLRRRWMRDLGLTYEDAEVLSETPELAAYFEAVASRVDPKTAANWVRGELRAQLRELGQEPWESRVTPERLAELIGLVEDRTLSTTLAKEVLADVARTGSEPRAVVEERGLGQISDEGELVALVERLLAENPAQAEQLRGGKDKVVGFFVGQAMKASRRPGRPRPDRRAGAGEGRGLRAACRSRARACDIRPHARRERYISAASGARGRRQVLRGRWTRAARARGQRPTGRGPSGPTATSGSSPRTRQVAARSAGLCKDEFPAVEAVVDELDRRTAR